MYNKRFICEACGARFTEHYGLLHHQRNKHAVDGNVPSAYECQKYRKNFGDNFNLTRHVLICGNESSHIRSVKHTSDIKRKV